MEVFLVNNGSLDTSDNPREQAQYLIDQAYQSKDQQQTALIDGALDAYPNSPDEYLFHAILTDPFEEEFMLIEQTVDAG